MAVAHYELMRISSAPISESLDIETEDSPVQRWCDAAHLLWSFPSSMALF